MHFKVLVLQASTSHLCELLCVICNVRYMLVDICFDIRLGLCEFNIVHSETPTIKLCNNKHVSEINTVPMSLSDALV